MTRVYSVISALTSSFCAWQDMGHRKRPRLSGKKGARKHGGGQRKAAQPADDRFEADSDASGSEASSSSSASLQSAEDSGKAKKSSALASPRSSAIFSSKDGRTSDAIAMLFNEQRHWRFVALVGKEKVHTQRLQPSSPRKYQLSASQASRKPSSLVWADALLLEPIRFPASA